MLCLLVIFFQKRFESLNVSIALQQTIKQLNTFVYTHWRS